MCKCPGVRKLMAAERPVWLKWRGEGTGGHGEGDEVGGWAAARASETL